jgi:hypothetical protein
MNGPKKIAFALFTLVVILSGAFAAVYLFRAEFMPYHAAAVGKSWTELDGSMRILILGFLRVVGGGWLATFLALAILLFIPFRRGEVWARWAILLVGSAAAGPTLYATLLIKRGTPGNPPWYAAAAAMALLLAGFLLSPERGGKGKEGRPS